MNKLIATAAVAVSLVSAQAALSAGTPSVTTGSATQVTNTTATVNGTVNPNGQSTSYTFQYGTTSRYGQQTAVSSAGKGTQAQTVSANLVALRPGTIYHFRIIATNASGTSAGADATFTTTGSAPVQKSPPTVTTGAATEIKRNGATLKGQVNPQGTSTSYYFEYGLTGFYGTQTTPANLAAGSSSTVPVTAVLRGIQAGEQYHYRLVATNEGGTTVGEDRTFRTGAARAGVGLTATTTPGRVSKLPQTFVTRGRLNPAAGRSVKRACQGGKVEVTFKAGRVVLSQKRVGIARSCTYTSRARVTPPRNKRGRYNLSVVVRFLGNAVVKQTTGPQQVIRVG